jgi:hypothetical protein
MGDPPLAAPSYQVKPSVVAVRWDVSSAIIIGASGFVKIMAPFPESEIIESPYMLVAVTVA